MMKQLLIFSIAIMMFSATSGQDIQFSQYHASPMTLNPAMTGFFDGNFRAIANYRNQWGTITPGLYRTVSGSVEGSFLKGRLENDYLSGGLVVVQDWAGSLKYATTSVGMSASYSKGFGYNVKHAVKVGFQGVFNQLSLNTNDGAIFPDGMQEVFSTSKTQFDFSAGVLYHTIPRNRLNMYVGFAYHHILQPEASFLGDGSVKTDGKIAATVGALVELGNNVNLIPSVMVLYQGGSYQVNGGSYVQFILGDQFDSETSFSLGTWARVSKPIVDAVIVGARFDYRSITAAVTYDVNVSELSGFTNGRGAFEASLIYIADLGGGNKYKGLDCPRF